MSGVEVVPTSQLMGTSLRLASPKATSRKATARAATVLGTRARSLGGRSGVLIVRDDSAHAPCRGRLRQRRADPRHRARLDARGEVALPRYGSAFTDEHKREPPRHVPDGRGRQARARPARRPGRPSRAHAELYDLVLVEVDAGVEPMPGAVELLRALRAAGVPVGLVVELARGLRRERPAPRGPGGRLRRARDRRGGRAAQAGARRYVAAAVALGAAPSECAVLEDSPHRAWPPAARPGR